MAKMHKFGICLRCVAAIGLLASLEGCRSTRNSLSNIPGMGWMANKEPNVSDWETDGALPTKPTTEATPLVASRTKSKSDPATAGKKDIGQESTALADRSDRSSTAKTAAESARKVDAAVAESSSTKRDKYDTGRYDAGRTGTEAKPVSTGTGRGGAVASSPKRGFYGSEYGDESGATEGKASGAASGSAADRASETVAAASAAAGNAVEQADGAAADEARSYSRFSQRVAPAAGETPGRYADREDGVADETYADAAREFSSEAVATARDARDELKEQLQDGVRAAAAVPRELAESTEESAREAYQKAGRQAVAVQDELEQGIEAATNAVKEEVAETRKELGKVGRGAAEAADEAITQTARAADQAVTSGAKSAEAAAGRAYSRFRNRFVGSDESAEATAPGEAEPAASEPAAASGNRSAEPAALPVKRSNQPWRPGSTGDYSANKATQATGSESAAREPAVESTQERESTVEPAAYQDASRSRFSPSYR